MCESSQTPDVLLKCFIDNLHATIDNKYNDILDIYYNNVGSDITKEDYTDNYGSVSNIILNSWNRTIEFDVLPKNRWYIHQIINTIRHVSSSTINYYLIDNYGIIYKNCAYHNRNGEVTYNKTIHIIGSSAYRLPNKVIDFIKTIGECSSIESINFSILGESFHNKFIQYKELYKSGKLIDYNALCYANNKLMKELEDKNKIISDLQKNIDNLNIKSSADLKEKEALSKKQQEEYDNALNQMREEHNKLQEKYTAELKKASDIYSADIKQLEAKYKTKEDEYVDIIIKLKEERRNMRILLATTSTEYSSDDFRSCI